jgi:vancomycin permeability regulator SanA
MKKKNRKNSGTSKLKSVLGWLLAVAIFGLVLVFGIDALVRQSVSDRILTQEQASELADVDCILVLGCLVHTDGDPSDMLEDRLKRGVALYDAGAAPKLLMSGDHGREGYDEVDAMKRYAVEAGIPSADVFMDHAGFSTYESVYRAKEIFCADKILIVTQEYHLYRALYIARAMGIEAYGVSADYRGYLNQEARDLREVLARVKDFAMCIFKPEPTYLGETIPVWGDGELTHDDKSDFS